MTIVLVDALMTDADARRRSHAWRFRLMQSCDGAGIYITDESDRENVWSALHRRYGDRLAFVESATRRVA